MFHIFLIVNDFNYFTFLFYDSLNIKSMKNGIKNYLTYWTFTGLWYLIRMTEEDIMNTSDGFLCFHIINACVHKKGINVFSSTEVYLSFGGPSRLVPHKKAFE